MSNKEKEKEQKKEPEISPAPEKVVNEGLSLELLSKELEECKKQKDEYLAGWQRERADFLNYKKEEMERISSLVAYSNEEIVMNFFPILDNLDIAERNIKEDLKKDSSVQGLLMIGKQIRDFLKNFGVEEIKSVGEKFDPRLHEIASEVESSEASAKEGAKAESGTIIEEIKKGYKINGRLLRPASVKVVR
jgi:molecular chaperone GrpE